MIANERVTFSSNHMPLPIKQPGAYQAIVLWLLSLLFAFCATSAIAGSDASLQLAIPGQALSRPGDDSKDALSAWYALSLNDGVLSVQQANGATPSNTLFVTGKRADQLLEGYPLRRPAKSGGQTVNAPADALLLMRIHQNTGGFRQLTPGEFPSQVTAHILHEGWLANGEVGGRKWNFAVTHKKRPDGKLLAGSLSIVGTADGAAPQKVLVPQASTMAFNKQELLWLGDLNGDGEPDLLLKRTWVTGEMDFVLVVSSMLATAYVDPDHPAAYFSSGVEPDSNSFEWTKNQAAPTPIKFSTMGTFTIGEEEWARLLPADSMALPKMLTDRQFKLNGETVRVTLEHLPRVADEGGSSAGNIMWDGTVLVRLNFRGKSQVLMQAAAPDGGGFSLSVGMLNGRPGVLINYQPHYNNSFVRYWIFDEAEARFRRLQSAQMQGC